MHDWQLPPGVSRSMWEYAQDASIARNYDADLEGTPLLKVDLDFFREHCPASGRLLDLGCGTGRLSIPAAQEGRWVVAVDLSPRMLEVVGKKAREASVIVHRLAVNIVELDCLADASFDHVACLFSTLGLVEGRENRIQVLRHAYRLLRPGGVFVLHVHNRWMHLGTRFGRQMLFKNWWRSLRGKEAKGDFVMPPQYGVGEITMHLFTRREIVTTLRRAEFAIREVRPVSHRTEGTLRWPWLMGRLRAYGYLIAAGK